MNSKRIVILLIFVFLAGACLFLPARESKDASYKLGPKDLIKITVFDVPDLNITVRISADGTITLPLLGRIETRGLTRFQLERELARLLEAKYLRNAQVTIFVQEYHSNTVSVMGEVGKPGTYELIGRQTLLQVLSSAGGLSEAASDRIIIIRQYKSGSSRSLAIDLDDLMVKGDPRLNIPLRAGDIINIPGDRFIDIYVFGQVKKPGHIKVKKSGPVTLLKVIAQAGGFADRARKTAVMVTRTVSGKEIKTKVNVKKILKGGRPDFVLQDNDIVHVPESIL
ncbi:MAG: polysaccharide biosynthesis/export family protein [Candidatus Aminicenantes bacterium]|nr:polysaccharide biosynthesis/export family protein [Candidatus Aminicenantes bacterium]